MKKRIILLYALAAFVVLGCKRDAETPDYRLAFVGDFEGTCECSNYQMGQYNADTGDVTVLVRLRDSTHLNVTIVGAQSFQPSVDEVGLFGEEEPGDAKNFTGGLVGEDSLNFSIYESHINYGYGYRIRARRKP